MGEGRKPGVKPGKRVMPTPTSFRAPGGDTSFRIPKSAYSHSVARKICEQLMEQKSLKQICSKPGMPSIRSVIRWLADPRLADFREMYYYARRVAAELYVDEIFEIADDTSGDWEPTYDKDGNVNGYKPNTEAIQRSRVRIDTRKWYAAKLVPRIYGDKVEVDLDATGDLAELLKKASNNDSGLPPPIDHE